MRVLLAGASGAIGRYLIPQLIAAKHQVIGITRTAGSLADTGATEIVGDILDRPALLAALKGVKADAVIHQATSLTKAPSRYRDMRETNRLRAEGTSTLIAAAKLVGASKFVAASFFGGYGFNDLGPVPLHETAPFGEPDDRNDAVLVALLSLEQQVRAFGGVSLRYGLFYDDTLAAASPVSRTWGGLIPNIHLKDAAHAAVLALSKYKAGSVYNIADATPMTYRDREIARAEASKIKPPQQLPDGIIRVGAPFGSMLLTRVNMQLDTSKARTDLGWKPEYPSLLDHLGVSLASSDNAPVIPRAPRKPKVAPVSEEPLVPEALEGPAPEHEEPEEAPVPDEPLVDGETPVPEALEGATVEEPASDEPAATDKAEEPPAADKPATPEDPFDRINAAIARIGSEHGD